VCTAWDIIRGWLIPVVVLLLLGSRGAIVVLSAIIVLPQIAFALVRYFTFFYRITDTELMTRQGLVEKRESHIRLERVQDIRVEQSLLHRLLNMAVVQVETAGGMGAEATLSVIPLQRAEQLRQAVFARKLNLSPSAAAPEPEPAELLHGLSVRDLIVAGLTSNRMATVLVFLGSIWWFVDQIISEEEQERALRGVYSRVENLISQGTETALLAGFLLAAGIIVTSMLFSAIGSVVLFYGFRLTRRGDDLHRSYGLLTRRTSSLPRRRIQVLLIEEGLLRRCFGLAALRADTAGPRQQQGEESTGRDVLLPILPRPGVDPLLPVFFPNIETGDVKWRQVSPLAVRRGTFKGSLVCLALTGIAMPAYGPTGLLALLPLIYLINLMEYRNLGYSLGEDYFRTRRGWFNRSTHVVPIRNTQAVLVHRNPFDRRLGLATLQVDTAGQAFTGGGPRIANLPLGEALALARVLSQRATLKRYRWQSK
jgi:putative membrane protein